VTNYSLLGSSKIYKTRCSVQITEDLAEGKGKVAGLGGCVAVNGKDNLSCGVLESAHS